MNRKLRNHELGRKTVDEFKKSDKLPIIIVLDNIRSRHNIGSVFRSADAFAVEKIYLCGYTAQPPHNDIHKTALGATESVTWEYRESIVHLISELNHRGVHTISVEQAENSTMLDELTIQAGQTYALIFGNEVKGVEQQVVNLSQNVVEIPQLGTKHSLNIAVSAGVVLWEFFRQLR